MSLYQIFTILLIGLLVSATKSARILCIFPTPSISHQFVFRGLTLALNERGHDLTIVTPNPLNDGRLKKYKEIDISFYYSAISELNYTDVRKESSWFEMLSYFCKEKITNNVELIMNMPEFKKIHEPESEEQFDLVIIQVLFWHSFYPLVKRFDAPWIGIISSAAGVNADYVFGNPIMPSDPSTWELEHRVVGELTFWRRLSNYYNVWSYLYFFRNEFISEQEKLARHYFGNYGSTIKEIEKNASLVFVNQQAPTFFPKPVVPKFIEIGGTHVAKQPKPLPQELKEILDNAVEGFVYMSLGSNVKSRMLPNETRRAFITAFAKLPYTVLWKFEEDALQEKPDNVHTMKWVPQEAVLAHPNIKLFIYQGGLQSTEEAIHHAVPLIGFPTMADQDVQIAKMVSLGVCKKLEILDVNAEQVIEAVTTIAMDNGYKQRMLNLRALVNDKPHDSMENAVWWTEHVIRHRGTPYLHSTTADLPWYQHQDMDLVAFISVGCLIAFSTSVMVLYRLVVHLSTVFSASSKLKLN